MYRIQIIEDNTQLSNAIKKFLSYKGYDVIQSFNGKSALVHLKEFNPDIVLIDNILPDIKGIEICESIKDRKDIGKIFLTTLSEKYNILDAFNAGAEDYITKPFDYDILEARIESLLKRINTENNKNIATLKSLGLEKVMYELLTKTEYKIIQYLFKRINEWVTPMDILLCLYGKNADSYNERNISVHIANIRKKVDKEEITKFEIESKYKKGYKLTVKR